MILVSQEDNHYANEAKKTRTGYARYKHRISRRQEQAMLDTDIEYLEDKNRLC